MKKYSILTLAAALSSTAALASPPTADYAASSIDARLNVTVKEGTEVVHFVRDNVDPNVITKAYQVKYVDPYELRSYLRGIVQTRKIDGKNTNVEAVKFNDGTSILLISAEDYRFNDTPGAQGFDSIVKELDKPKLVASSGRVTYVYSPVHRSSAELMEMVNAVGIYTANKEMNNVGGTDVTINDPGLNLIFFNTAPFSRRTIMEVLKAYDQPYPEVRAKVTVYELYAENDTKLGMDFQAWKNNEGIDLLSVGGRFSRNHNGVDLVNGAKFNKTTYFQFNPKWNTKYIDFLTSKGKAKVLHSSELTLRNNTPGTISKKTQVFVAKTEPVAGESFTESYAVIDIKPADGELNRIVGYDGNDMPITATEGVIEVLKLGKDADFEYTLRAPEGSAARFESRKKGVRAKAVAMKVTPEIEAQLTAIPVGHKRGNKINTEASNQFGFDITLTPSVNTKATALNVKVENSSLIGYTSNGTPRIQKGAAIDTDFMISNDGTQLVIGGIEKRSVMRVSGGIPILKDLPLLGWLFSTETEATKRSQLLVVAEVLPVSKAADYKENLDAVKSDLTKAGESNSFGYRQYLIDTKR